MSSRSFDSASSQSLRKINMPPAAKAAAGWAKTDTAALQWIWTAEHWAGIPATVRASFSIFTLSDRTLGVEITDLAGSSGVVTSTTFQLNTWFHWACWIDTLGGTINVMLNGGGKGSGGYTEAVQLWVRHSIAAHWNGGVPFNGQIAHVAMFGTALKDSEVLALYEGRCPPMDVGFDSESLIYYAPLDHDDLCQFRHSGGAQLVWGPRNSPTFSDDDPRVVPMFGGLVGV